MIEQNVVNRLSYTKPTFMTSPKSASQQQLCPQGNITILRSLKVFGIDWQQKNNFQQNKLVPHKARLSQLVHL